MFYKSYNKYVVLATSSRNSLLQFTGIATVNKVMYTDILRRLEMRSEWHFPKNGEPTVGSYFTAMLQQTRRLWSRLFTKEQYNTHWNIPTTLRVQLIFTRLKSALKGRRFCDATDIIEDATEKLKRVPQNGCFEHLYNRWQKYIVVKRNILKEM
jgi:hypothetical protein